MLKTLFCIIFYSLSQYSIYGQMQLGASVFLDYNLYHWYQEPYPSSSGRSVGQVLNVLPTGGLGFWGGRPQKWMLGVEGNFDFMPISLDFGNVEGFGALSLSTLMRLYLPLKGDSYALGPYLSLGGGVQWNKTALYFPPATTPFYRTLVGEVCFGLGSGWGNTNNPTHLIGLFARAGTGQDKALSFNLGLRIGILSGTKEVQSPWQREEKPEERLYHTML